MAATQMTTEFTCSECSGDLRVGLPKLSEKPSVTFQMSVGPCSACMGELKQLKSTLKNIMNASGDPSD